MKKLTTLILSVSCLSALAQKKDNRIVVGTVDTVYSTVLNEKRTVLVHVPDGDKTAHYPVLYVLDGEEHFLSAVAITEQLNGVIPPMIVVGINNTIRERDLTPTKVMPDAFVNAGDARLAGGGEIFMAFIEKELMPYMSSHYPVAAYTLISGHSLGGLAVINALFNHTGLFNAYIAIDPSLWWDQQRWIKKYEGELPARNFGNRSLFVAIANNIPPGLDTVSVLNDTLQMSAIPRAVIPFVAQLKKISPQGLHLGSKFYPNERHGTVELNAEYDALRYLFGFYQFRMSQFIGHPELDEDSVIAAHYKLVSQKMGYTVQPTESNINNMAYDCMARGKYAVALKLFKRNIENYPQSANAYDSLGEYYAGQGDKKNAIAAYTRSLSLQETADTRRKLNELIK